MRSVEILVLGIRNVFMAPVRSCLTILGLGIGVASILAVLTLGSAGQSQVRSEMNRLGINKVWVTSDDSQRLQYGEGIRAAETLSLKATEQIYLTGVIEAENRSAVAVIAGCTEAFTEQVGLRFSEGCLLKNYEWGNTQKAVMLGKKLAKELDVKVGDQIKAVQEMLFVRGIVESAEGVTGSDPQETLFVPVHLLLDQTQGTIHKMLVDVPSGKDPGTVAKMIRHMVYLQQGVDADVETMQVQVDAANSVIDTFISVLEWVALICMLVGGIGVMNILLVGVRERRREIGIMQSLGVNRTQITFLFLWEAMIYAILGGVLGIVMGIVLTNTAGKSIDLAAVVQINDCVTVLAAAVCTGLFFGVTPAVKASGLKPVDALRSE